MIKHEHFTTLDNSEVEILEKFVYKNVFAPDTLGSQPDTYLVPVNCMLGLGVWHIDAI